MDVAIYLRLGTIVIVIYIWNKIRDFFIEKKNDSAIFDP
jgi:hypothetical protein